MTPSHSPGVRSIRSDRVSPPPDERDQSDVAGNLVQERVSESTTSPEEDAGLVRETVLAHAPMRLFGTGVRILFGLIWVVDVYFKWQPSFLHRLPEVMSDGAQGQPGWLMPWFNLAKGVIAVHPTAWAYAIALVETGIALALILGFARKLTYVGGAIYSLMIWSTAEGLGRTSGVATDIGTAIVYAVVFLALVALDARGKGTRPYSVDAVIERRLPWWRRLAEVRR